MGLITITSDWGDQDHYAAAVKAKVYSYFPDARIIDVSHHVPLFDIGKAAYFLRNVYPYSPEGTVHLIGVNTISGKDRAHLIVCSNNQFFVGADNGIFSLLFPKNEIPTAVYEITEMQDHPSFTFPSRDLFAKVAASLAQGTPPEKLGKQSQIQNLITPSAPIVRYQEIPEDGSTFAEIVGEVNYIDRYGNINTNIHRNLFDSMLEKFANFEINYKDPIRKILHTESIRTISKAYSDVRVSDVLALFTGDGYLQISQNESSAANMLGFRLRMPVIIRFWNKKL